MNRIPFIAAAVALIALLLAGYLALSSRISRLEEAATTLRGEPAPASGSAIDELAALRYDGTGNLRLAPSTRLTARPEASPFSTPPPAVSQPEATPLPVPELDAPVSEVEAPAPAESPPPPPPAQEQGQEAQEAPERTAEALRPPPVIESAPIVPAPDKPGWFAQLRDLVGLGSEPTQAEIEAGIREVLNASTAAALASLGRPGGYANDPEVAIPLPQKLEAVRSVLKGVGMAALMDDLRNRINRAAELAAPDTVDVFRVAVAELPLDDPSRLQARDDAATVYLRTRMAGRLAREMRPLVDQRLNEVGAHGLYRQALGVYSSLPFVPAIDGDLTSYVTSRGLDAIFLRTSVEERQIRSNPVRHTTVAMRAALGGAD